MIPSQTIP